MSHNTRARRGGCALGALAAFTLLQSASVGAATVSWDGGGDGTSWSDPLNWSGDALPGSDDTAVLNVAAEPAVVLTGPAVTVAVLDCREALTLAGDGLTVTGAATVRSQVLRLEGLQLKGLRLKSLGLISTARPIASAWAWLLDCRSSWGSNSGLCPGVSAGRSGRCRVPCWVWRWAW